MKPPLRRNDEQTRLEALRRYQALDTLPAQTLGEITALAAQLCEAPIAVVTFVDDQWQWFRAGMGMDIGSALPRQISFCGHAIRQTELFVVLDAAIDERFSNHPHVSGPPGIRFYAGAPLVTADGHALGTLSIMDSVPRQLTAVQQQGLKVLSRQVMAQLELHLQKRQLALSEEHFSLALDAAHMGTFDWDIPANRIVWSRWHEELWGYGPGEFDGSYEAFARRLHPEDLADVQAEVARCIAARTPLAREVRVVWPDGSLHWIASRGEFTFDSEGRPLRMRGAVIETTERKQAEEKARHLIERITLATDAASIGIWDWNLKTDEWYASPVYCSMLGYPPDKGPGDRAFWLRRLHPDDQPQVEEKILSIKAGSPVPYEYEARMRHADGSYRWIHVIGRVLSFDEQGKASRLMGVRIDITERKLAELRIQESEDRFRELADNIQEVFWMSDPAGSQILYVSPAYEKIWGRPCAGLYQSPAAWLDAIHPDDRARMLHAMATKKTRGDYDETYRIRRPDGTVRWIHDRAYVVRGQSGPVDGPGDGPVVRVVGTAEDITEARHLEDQLRQSQKMEAIGQLAGGVAHDFNNILAAIMMQSDLAARMANVPSEARQLLYDIKAATARAANLTRQLLAFSRRQVMQPRLLNLNDSVTNLTKMLQRILGEDVNLQTTLHPRPLLTRADAGMIDQVLLNLVINGRDAMPGGGVLVVKTAERVVTDEEGAAITDASPGRYVCLIVTDSGGGIASQHLPRIFDPFYTTKEPGKGTGLGLATVFGIVKQHGGWLAVDSRVGHGSTFQVCLRAAEDAEVDPIEDLARPLQVGGTEMILLVEDEPAVRMLTRVVLEGAGYLVWDAPNGVEALRIWDRLQAEKPKGIRLLLTDIVMPEGVSGRELAARLQARDPGLRVIFTSGYSADIAGRELVLQEGQNFVQKPSSPRHLLETVRRCLDR